MFFMNQIKLVVSDLDGTLLNDNKEIDSKISDVIKSLYEKGILFTIATGRNYSLSKKIINVLKDSKFQTIHNENRTETLYLIDYKKGKQDIQYKEKKTRTRRRNK